MRHSFLPLALPAVAFLTLGVVACGDAGTGGADPSASATPAASPGAAPTPVASATADPLAAQDAASGTPDRQPYPDPEKRPVMQAQVVLDRLGFTPGVVDGQMGLSTRNAVRGFQMANEIRQTGELDQPTQALLNRAMATIPATRVVTIPADFAAGPFLRTPRDPQEQAKMPVLAYQSLDEKLAERFHTTLATLRQLNPDGAPAGLKSTSPAPATAASPSPSASPTALASDAPLPSIFHAGQQVRVPNVGNDAIAPGSVKDADWAATLASLGVASQQPAVDRLIVSKSQGTLMAYDASGKLVAVYTATMGSSHDPLPLGEWKVQGVSRNPKFHYNPKLFWDAKPGSDKATLPAGPNGPVGVVWIDLNIPHYGIHGTPEPSTIGRAESHGCVRLTNWDAARLAQMVRAGTRVSFVA